ncbi:MAG TPA: transglutaminase-like domain-containing protein [Candidatus Acidoferrum sp.]|nr:transglutaminase-like domain-containing protein [Candidatus Acidoferrum sp.]
MHPLCSTGSREALCPTLAGLRLRLGLLVLAVIGWFAVNAQARSPALTLDLLRSDPTLTPERFASYFRDFEFKLGETRQAPEAFLAARCGDCDDYACLASEVLREKHYTTKLVAVFMKGQTHVVCYVDEIHGYLDYNLRKQTPGVQLANGKLEEIADKVAAYFRSSWRSASEVTYNADQPRLGRIVFAAARTARKPAMQGSAPARQTASASKPGPAVTATATPGL